MILEYVVEIAYFAAALLFILGLKKMGHPLTARKGIIWAGVGMVIATVITYVHPQIGHNYGLITLAIILGGALAWWSGKKVAITDMPQMVALYNGLGGGAAAAIAAVELIRYSSGHEMSQIHLLLAVAGALIGTVAFSGSMIAFAKLQGLLRKTIRFPSQQLVNGLTFLVMIILGGIVASGNVSTEITILFFVVALAFGVMMTVPIGGADMPVVISLYNAFTGLAVAAEGFVLGNAAMIIAGIVVGAAGTLLTQEMAKAMNRSLANVLFSNFGDTGSSEGGDQQVTGSIKEITAQDTAIMMSFAEKVIIVPGYGMAAARAQHKIWELTQLLTERGVTVKFAIHPVAGRMPGHMNVLLAEADVPYDMIYDLDEINDEFSTADVAFVIGANDTVNPSARTDTSSPIYGMPILNVDQAKNAVVNKRGRGTGFSGVENVLFFADNTRMLYGNGDVMVNELVSQVKALGD